MKPIIWVSFLLFFLLEGCVKKDQVVTVIPIGSEIKGELGEYIQIPTADYILEFKDSNKNPKFKVNCFNIKPIPKEILRNSSIQLKGYFLEINGQKVDSFLVSKDDQAKLFSVLSKDGASDSIVFVQERFNAYPYMGMLYEDNKKFKKNLEKSFDQVTTFNVMFYSSISKDYLTVKQISDVVKNDWPNFVTQYYKKSKIIEGEIATVGISKTDKGEFVIILKKDPENKIDIYVSDFSDEDIEKAKSLMPGQIVRVKGTMDSNGKSIHMSGSSIEWN